MVLISWSRTSAFCYPAAFVRWSGNTLSARPIMHQFAYRRGGSFYLLFICPGMESNKYAHAVDERRSVPKHFRVCWPNIKTSWYSTWVRVYSCCRSWQITLLFSPTAKYLLIRVLLISACLFCFVFVCFFTSFFVFLIFLCFFWSIPERVRLTRSVQQNKFPWRFRSQILYTTPPPQSPIIGQCP